MRLFVFCIAAMLVAVAAAGCGESWATIQHTQRPLGQQKEEVSEAAYQFTDVGHIEIVLSKEWVAPVGEAVPDFTYHYFLVPHPKGRHTVEGDGVIVYRLARRDGRTFLYKATSGWVDHRFAIFTKDHLHAEFEVEFVQVWPKPEQDDRFPLKGEMQANESVRTTQALINRYHLYVTELLKKAAAEPSPPAPQPSAP
ncbi:MAG: hypothetical protein JXL80_01080 [Planctomycetes bacterium]|nr:hypothetical protein [Planctomycetota bacterium]